MIIIDLIFVCPYWQWGGKAASRAGWDRDGKSHGERSPHQEFGPQNGDLPWTSQKKEIFGRKKPNLALKKKVLQEMLMETKFC